MLSIHKGHFAAYFLALSQDVQGQGGLTGGFRAIDLNDSALGNTANTEGGIQRQRAGGNGLHIHIGAVAKTHDRALAITFLNLSQGSCQCFLLIRCGGRCFVTGFLSSHYFSSFLTSCASKARSLSL